MNTFFKLSLPAVLLTGALLAFPESANARPAYFTRYDMTHNEYQQEYNNRVARGYRLKYIDGYNRSGAAKYAAIWQKVSGPRMIARHGLTRAQLNSEIRSRIRGGAYQAVLIDGYESGGEDRYAVIWEKRTVPQQAVAWMMTGSKYQEKFNRLKAKGYYVSYVSGYSIGNKVYYAAIWDKILPGASKKFARHGMGHKQFGKEIRRLSSKNMRLAHVSAYSKSGVPYYAAIWEKSRADDPLQVDVFGMSPERYNYDFFQRKQEGYLPKVISGNEDGGEPRYAIIYETIANPDTSGRSCQAGKCFSLSTLKREIEDKILPLSQTNIHKYAFEFSLGNSKVTGASGLRRFGQPKRFSVNDRINPASVTKSTTAVGLINAVNDKPGIDLDSPIGPFLPSNWNSQQYVKDLTFAQVLSHRTGLTKSEESCGSSHDITFGALRKRVELNAGPDTCGPGDRAYSNANYALARVLVASLDGYSLWDQDDDQAVSDRKNGRLVGERFINYMNRHVFGPIGLRNVRYTPTSTATLFYPWPTSNPWPDAPTGISTDFGDWSKKPGSAGVQLSIHELNIFARGLFNGSLLDSLSRNRLMSERIVFSDHFEPSPGVKCYKHGGYLPQKREGKMNYYNAQLSSILLACDNGLRGAMVINGLNLQSGSNTPIDRTVKAALKESFQPE